MIYSKRTSEVNLSKKNFQQLHSCDCQDTRIFINQLSKKHSAVCNGYHNNIGSIPKKSS